MGRDRITILRGMEETLQFGVALSAQIALQRRGMIALKGDLGAGKTTFVQGILQGLDIEDTAQSPTFTYLQIYQGRFPIYHFDLYRLPSEQDFISLGFEEYFYIDGLTIIEWPERVAKIIPAHAWFIELFHEGPSQRTVNIRTWNER